MSEKLTENPFKDAGYYDFKPVGEVLTKDNINQKTNYNSFVDNLGLGQKLSENPTLSGKLLSKLEILGFKPAYLRDKTIFNELLEELEKQGIKRISEKTLAGASALVLTTNDNQMIRIISSETKKLQSLPPTVLQPLYTILPPDKIN